MTSSVKTPSHTQSPRIGVIPARNPTYFFPRTGPYASYISCGVSNARTNHMLQATFERSYVTVNKHGVKTPMFVYRVSGTPEELAAFEQAQGEFYRTDSDGTPVWITPRGQGQSATLIILEATEDRPARVVADTSAIAMASSLMEQYKGTAIADALARQIAEVLTGKPQHTPEG